MTQLGINLPTLVAYLLNFVVLLGVLYAFAYKPLLKAMDQRSERIRESLEAADKARDEAAIDRSSERRSTFVRSGQGNC